MNPRRKVLMNSQTSSLEKVEYSIHPATRIGIVSLTVANLDNQVAFYQRSIGLRLHWRAANQAGLGAGGDDLLILTQKPGARRYQRVTGLYHFALLFPDRRELGRVVARLFSQHYRNYPTDHILTKSTYLDDPEGNGIELYAESPEDGEFIYEDGKFLARRADGSLSDGREPLELDALFSNLNVDEKLDLPVPSETRIGHVHLHVRNVDEAVDFYHGVIGFDVMGLAPAYQVAFVSAGGYHHHIGLNTWQGEGAPSPPEDALGLRHFSISLPNQEALNEVVVRIDSVGIPETRTEHGVLLRDPSQNGVMLSVS
jgi:catechol 2,3-dioxygenase